MATHYFPEDRVHFTWNAGHEPVITIADGDTVVINTRDVSDNQIGPDSGVARDYYYFPGDGFGYGYGFAVRTDPGTARPPPPGSIGELKWDSGSGTYFGVDPSLDMIYILLEQTQTERGRIVPAFKKLVYDAFAKDETRQDSNGN